MSTSRDDLHRVVDLFAAAALDRAMWVRALERLAELTGSSHAQLIGIGGPREVRFNIVPDLPSRATMDFVSIDGGSPQVNARMAAVRDTQAMECVSDEMLETYRRRIGNSDYSDFKATYDIPFGAQTSLVREGEKLIALVLLRSARQGYTTPEQLETFRFVAPFAGSAVRMHNMIEGRGEALFADYMDALEAPLFVCDARGTVLSRTLTTDPLLSGGSLSLESGRLAGRDARDTARLRSAIEMLANAEPGRTGGELAVVMHDGPRPLVLDLHVVPEKSGPLGRSRRIVVAPRVAGRKSQARMELLIDAYRLTKAEALAACGLLDGMSRQRIARERGVSELTVHTQIKSVFVKCEVQREAELVALLSRLLTG